MHDVIVIGLGAMGSAAAYEIAATGAKVLGLEQFDPLHDKGSSHGRTRMIRKAYLEGDFYIPLLMRSFERWRALSEKSGKRLINECGVFYAAPEGDAIVANTLKSARLYDLEVEEMDAKEARKRFPAFRPPADYQYLYEPEAGYADPDTALAVYHALAKEQGAELRFNEKVLELEAGAQGATVKTDKGGHRAHRLVIAAGAWLGALAPKLGLDLPLEAWRMALHWFRAKPGGAKPRMPNVWRTAGGGFLYGFPEAPGETGCKYAFHDRHNRTVDPENPDRSITDEEITEIAKAVSGFVPALATHIAAKSCLYTMTPDEHFVIGLHPTLETVALAGGFSGHGFKFMPVVGEILRDLALDAATEHEIAAFSPQRFKGGGA